MGHHYPAPRLVLLLVTASKVVVEVVPVKNVGDLVLGDQALRNDVRSAVLICDYLCSLHGISLSCLLCLK